MGEKKERSTCLRDEIRQVNKISKQASKRCVQGEHGLEEKVVLDFLYVISHIHKIIYVMLILQMRHWGLEMFTGMLSTHGY